MSSRIDSTILAEHSRLVLGIIPPFGQHELKKHYHREIRKYHPDLNHFDTSHEAEATERTKQLNLAYEFLSEYVEDIGGLYHAKPEVRPSSPQSKPYERPRPEPRRYYEGKRYTVGFPDHSVTEIFVKSSHIVSIGYNPRRQILYIKFEGDSVYRYFDVPHSLFNEFLSADSHGRFAHQNIYRSFDFERCS